MTIQIKKSEEETTIELVGRIDTTTAPNLEKTINEDIADTKNLVFDLRGIQYISSAGLRVILKVQKMMQKIETMKVKNVNDDVMEVFEITGFTDFLTIE